MKSAKIKSKFLSIKDINLEIPVVDPELDYLYHGTVSKFIRDIIDEGLKPQSKQYVHLSNNVEKAIEVGSRRGKPIVIVLDVNKMLNDNVVFYFSHNGIWLTKYVDVKYFDSILVNP